MTSISGAEQLALWAGFVALDTASRAPHLPLPAAPQPARALGPGRRRGDQRAAPRLRAAERLRHRGRHRAARRETTPATAAASPPSRWSSATTPTASSSPASTPTTRACWSWSAPSSRSASRSACCPARSTCSRRPSVTPNRVGGVPLIEVEALATQNAVPYTGPDRRATRSTKVSVVVPAMNEGKNIGQVLEQLPEGLHEVILVDGNSKDDTVEAARRAYPEHPRHHPERPRQGRRLPHRLRRRHRQPGRHARRRRLRRPGRDPRASSPRSRPAPTSPRARATSTAAAAPTSPGPASSATPASAAPPTSCTAPTSPTSVTATTPSGPAACPSSPSTCPASRSRP